MKTLRKVLVVLAILISLPLILALFLKKNYAVEREITINRPEAEVFNYVKLLRNQNTFSKWATLDPNMKISYSGTDGMAGFVSAWESESPEVGKGEQTIVNIKEGERIDYDLHFIKPFDGRAKAYMTTDPVSDRETLVKWGFSSKMKYPTNIMLLFMNMEKSIGNDFSTGLENLKRQLEQ